MKNITLLVALVVLGVASASLIKQNIEGNRKNLAQTQAENLLIDETILAKLENGGFDCNINALPPPTVVN